jgi:fructose-specific component phosphotransferase system IIB-like protein
MPTVRVKAKDKSQAAAIERAMLDPEVRAFVIVAGELMAVPTIAGKARVLAYVGNLVRDPDYIANLAQQQAEPVAAEGVDHE